MESIDGRPVSFSAINDHIEPIPPAKLNSDNTVRGGFLLDTADSVAAIAAMRHSGRLCKTRWANEVDFPEPAYQGEVLVFKAAVNRVWGTSLEVGIKVFADDLRKGIRRYIFSMYFTFVALDDCGRKVSVRPVIPETEDEKRRFADADVRRAENRAKAKRKIKQ